MRSIHNINSIRIFGLNQSFQKRTINMPTLHFTTVDVFTTERYLGNPLAIVDVPVGDGITDQQMQTIAREFNLSETIFIREREKAEDGTRQWRVRIFITTAELPFAGHPTIGAACYALGTLAGGESKARLIANAGNIELEYADVVAKAAIPHNFHRLVDYEFTVEDVCGLQPALKAAGIEPKTVFVASPVKGMNFVNVQLPDLDALGKVEVTGLKPQPILDAEWNVGFAGSYFYVVSSAEEGVVKVRTRMIEGIMEDPATGSAACGLSIGLALEMKLGRTTKFEITLAVEMGRKSDIGVEVTLNEGLDAAEGVVLSGSAVKVMEGTLEV